MGTFNGTANGDIITPTFKSPGVGGGGRPGQRADILIGNGGDDTLNGGTGGDSLSGGAGNDLMIYQAVRAGGDSATMDGGLGVDTLQVDGSSAGTGGWTLSLTDSAAGRAFVSGARPNQSFLLDTTDVEVVRLTGSALADQFTIANAVANTRLVTAELGAGDDVFRWDAGQAGFPRPVLDGGAGVDRLDVAPQAGLATDGRPWAGFVSADGFGNGADISMIHNGVATSVNARNVEVVNLTGGAGSDRLVASDMTGSGVTFVSIDLGRAGVEDDAADRVEIFGTAGRDVINIANLNFSDDVAVTGLAATVVVRNIDASPFPLDVRDTVLVHTGGGDDFITLENFNIDQAVIVDAGPGNDTIIASFGPAIFVYSRTGNHDVISGFKGPNNSMRIDVSALPDLSLAEAIANRHIFQQGPNVIIDDTQGSFIQVLNVSLSSLTAGDFIF